MTRTTMPPDYRFHVTKHCFMRIDERDLSFENTKMTVKYPDGKQRLQRGRHGGILWRFHKTVDGRTLVVVAEIKDRECWLLTSYHDN